MSKTVLIASDHAGFPLKAALIPLLREGGCTVEDLGTDGTASCDYPVFAGRLCERLIAAGEAGQNGAVLGILICGTGLGMSMAANRHAGVRAALCTCEFMAVKARAHNNANVLCLGGRVIGEELAAAIVRTFLDTEFEGGRHQRRIELFDNPA